jgi:hypothetical protein
MFAEVLTLIARLSSASLAGMKEDAIRNEADDSGRSAS